MKTAIIYARQSFGQEENSVSISNQVADCEAWAGRNGIKVIGRYSDSNCSSELYPGNEEGRRAADADRGYKMWKKEQRTAGRKEWKEGLGRALDHIAQAHPDYLLVYTQNRLGRTAYNSNLNNYLTSYLMANGCSLVDVANNSIMDFSDRIMNAFHAMKDALDYNSVAEKRRQSMEAIARRRDEYRAWSNAFGVVCKDNTVSFDPAKAEVVRFIFDKWLEGWSMYAIMKELNGNPATRELVQEGRRKGRQYYTTNIVHVLANPLYAGYCRDSQGRLGRAVNCAEPIIDFATWKAAQERERPRRAGQYPGRGHGHRHFLPFSGKIYCPCGRRMVYIIDKKKDVYICRNGGDHKMQRIVIDDRFRKCMEAFMHYRAGAMVAEALAKKGGNGEAADLECRIENLKQERLAKMRLVKTDADVSFYGPVMEDLKAQENALHERLLKVKAEAMTNWGDVESRTLMLIHQLKCGTLPDLEYRKLVAMTIDRITVHEDHVEVKLWNGRTVELPRTVQDKRGQRMLPVAEVLEGVEYGSWSKGILVARFHDPKAKGAAVTLYSGR